MTAPAPAGGPVPGASVLVVDDDSVSRRILSHMLEQEGHCTTLAEDGRRALDLLAQECFDIVLLDIRMPAMDGYEVCRRIRAVPETQALPVVMITAEGPDEKLSALDAGADDFLVKPFDRGEFLARIRSLLRIKRYHDLIQDQRVELAAWNRDLERRVADQVDEIERLGRLRRFLSDQVADLVLSSGDDAFLKPHRRFIAVCLCKLHGFSTFIEAAEPEELLGVLGSFYEALGEVLRLFGAAVGYLAGDSVLAYLNDPVPCDDPEARVAGMALALRGAMVEPTAHWQSLGYKLDVGMGVASGYATLGMSGFEGRYEYTPIGSVVNLAGRLAEQAGPGQILIAQRLCASIEDAFDVEMLGDITLAGFQRPTPAIRLVDARHGAQGA
ncbi:MAG: response regulator [Acidimicrobiales bacterium]